MPGSEPMPEPMPGSEPHPMPGSEPMPVPMPGSEPMPEPVPMNPMPTPMPMPVPVPMPVPTVDDFYLTLFAISKFGASYSGAISMSGNNDTITIFGNRATSGTMNLVQQFSLNPATYGWTNLTNWDVSKMVISYSQPPPDGSNAGGYPTYFLWSTASFPTHLFVSSFSSGNMFSDLFNVTITPGELGQK
jgi:hypothetical protein